MAIVIVIYLSFDIELQVCLNGLQLFFTPPSIAIDRIQTQKGFHLDLNLGPLALKSYALTLTLLQRAHALKTTPGVDCIKSFQIVFENQFFLEFIILVFQAATFCCLN